MNTIDKEMYIQRYNDRLKEYGHDIKTLGWGGDKERQFLRFQIAMELSSSIKSVLDVGCGFGDMGGDFLKNHYPHVKYTGIDINSSLIEEGKKKYPDLDIKCLDLLQDNITEKYDLVCESGIFNFKLTKEDQLAYIEKMLTKMFEISNYGISADFMSTFVDYEHDGAFHMNEYEIIKMAKKLSKRFIIRNDYLDYEYDIYILKGNFNDQ